MMTRSMSPMVSRPFLLMSVDGFLDFRTRWGSLLKRPVACLTSIEDAPRAQHRTRDRNDSSRDSKTVDPTESDRIADRSQLDSSFLINSSAYSLFALVLG
jgi:hypothetical protein